MWSSVFASQQYSMPMSQLGQKRKRRRFSVTSALPHEADINSRDCDVRFVPNPDIEQTAVSYLT